ncbi:phosphopantetheine-binding protein [Sphingosinicella sp. BN140058]|uniref:phosphopantetheine-binding protein n=1 Tax=Sphingosinicella sp. BN140058 TaxID=1892855 RepID=UPI0010109451|nr:phosphopantetheine-binding protein [Sphingosinicella sp. BN140058]QAY77236.1 acyl carrier protein [Sphingosinicella sp. BN140058]
MDETLARTIIADHLGVAPAMVVDAAALADLGADPLDVLALVLRLERAFGVRISDEQVEGCRTVAQVLQSLRLSLNCKIEMLGAGVPAGARL